MKQSPVIVLLGILAAASCGPRIQSARFTSVPARPPATEIRLYSAKLPECPFEELGLVSGKARYFWNSMDDILDSLKSRARAMGGDAIVSLNSAELVNGATQHGNVSTQAGIFGTVVRFSDPDCIH